MEVKDLDLPVPYHKTMDILDASKIQAFMDCPRKFFFSYVLGWQKSEPNIHLVFGSAWHEAMEYLLLHGYEPDHVILAYDRFMEKYREEYPSILLDSGHIAKNPDNALDALGEYAAYWRPYDNFTTLYTEIAFAVPVTDDIVLHGKMDGVIRDETNLHWSMEHKTTGRKTGAWVNSWFQKFQAALYTHALNVEFGTENVGGIKINGAVLRKSSNEFLRVPVKLGKRQMMQWQYEAQFWVNLIRWNFERLAENKVTDEVMTAFPRNTESCSKYGCPHPELCNQMPNPLERQDDIPLGYKKEFWDPTRQDVKNKLIPGEGFKPVEQKPKEEENDAD